LILLNFIQASFTVDGGGVTKWAKLCLMLKGKLFIATNGLHIGLSESK